MSLEVSSKSWYKLSHKPLNTFTEKLDKVATNISFQKPKQNLSYLEREGAKWCHRQIKTGNLYISQADKGGAILLLKPHEVHKIITTELQNTNKFKLLNKDPVKKIEQVLKTTMDNWVKKESMTQKERNAITGYSPPFKSNVKKAPQWALTKSLHKNPVLYLVLNSTAYQKKLYLTRSFLLSGLYTPQNLALHID